jgi:hypothetical protein
MEVEHIKSKNELLRKMMKLMNSSQKINIWTMNRNSNQRMMMKRLTMSNIVKKIVTMKINNKAKKLRLKKLA